MDLSLGTELTMYCDWQGKRTRISQELWDKIEPLPPRYRPSKSGGRPRVSLRGVVDGLWYILRTGCQWKELPWYYGSSSTVTSKSGRSLASSSDYGKSACKSMIAAAGFSGVGKARTAW